MARRWTCSRPAWSRTRPPARSLLDHLGNQTVARAWEQMDLALFGVGSYVRSEAWFGEQLLAELDAAGTVGEIMISPFDIQGRFVSDRLRTMVIGMDARDLKRVPTGSRPRAGSTRCARSSAGSGPGWSRTS